MLKVSILMIMMLTVSVFASSQLSEIPSDPENPKVAMDDIANGDNGDIIRLVTEIEGKGKNDKGYIAFSIYDKGKGDACKQNKLIESRTATDMLWAKVENVEEIIGEKIQAKHYDVKTPHCIKVAKGKKLKPMDYDFVPPGSFYEKMKDQGEEDRGVGFSEEDLKQYGIKPAESQR